MGSILALQVSVTEASLTSDIFTRRGGLRSEEPISGQECFNTEETKIFYGFVAKPKSFALLCT